MVEPSGRANPGMTPLGRGLHVMSATTTRTEVPHGHRRYETMQSAAERTGLSVKSIRRRIAEGHLTAYRLGQRVIRLDPAEVDDMFTATTKWAV